MTKICALVLWLSLSGCPAFVAPRPTTQPPPEPVSAVGRALDATVGLEGLDGSFYCSGVFVGEHVLTAAHCVDDQEAPATVDIVTRQGQHAEALVVFIDKDTDAAVLAPMRVIPGHASTKLAAADPAPGDRVIAVGHPRYFRWLVTQGFAGGVAAIRGHEGEWLYHSAPTWYGNSGGPVFNEYAEVVGITSWGRDTAHLSAAVPLKNLRAALN